MPPGTSPPPPESADSPPDPWHSPFPARPPPGAVRRNTACPYIRPEPGLLLPASKRLPGQIQHCRGPPTPPFLLHRYKQMPKAQPPPLAGCHNLPECPEIPAPRSWPRSRRPARRSPAPARSLPRSQPCYYFPQGLPSAFQQMPDSAQVPVPMPARQQDSAGCWQALLPEWCPLQSRAPSLSLQPRTVLEQFHRTRNLPRQVPSADPPARLLPPLHPGPPAPSPAGNAPTAAGALPIPPPRYMPPEAPKP